MLFRSDGENYDPTESYDPNGADNFGKTGRPGTTVIGNRFRAPQKKNAATFNVFIDGTGNVAAHNVELFNNQFSITKFANGSTNPGLIPGEATTHSDFRNSAGTGVAQYYGKGAILSNAGVGVGDEVYFDINGNLVYNYNVGNSDNVIISCQEVPYRSLFDYTASGAMYISKMRLQYSQAGQIQKDLTWTYKIGRAHV